VAFAVIAGVRSSAQLFTSHPIGTSLRRSLPYVSILAVSVSVRGSTYFLALIRIRGLASFRAQPQQRMVCYTKDRRATQPSKAGSQTNQISSRWGHPHAHPCTDEQQNHTTHARQQHNKNKAQHTAHGVHACVCSPAAGGQAAGGPAQCNARMWASPRRARATQPLQRQDPARGHHANGCHCHMGTFGCKRTTFLHSSVLLWAVQCHLATGSSGLRLTTRMSISISFSTGAHATVFWAEASATMFAETLNSTNEPLCKHTERQMADSATGSHLVLLCFDDHRQCNGTQSDCNQSVKLLCA
jgi:hypothetical protein